MQVAGAKDWTLRSPAIAHPRPDERRLALSPSVEYLATSAQTVRLLPGDLLYLPRGTPHSASTQFGDDSDEGGSTHLSISLYVTPQQTNEGAFHQYIVALRHPQASELGLLPAPATPGGKLRRLPKVDRKLLMRGLPGLPGLSGHLALHLGLRTAANRQRNFSCSGVDLGDTLLLRRLQRGSKPWSPGAKYVDASDVKPRLLTATTTPSMLSKGVWSRLNGGTCIS